MKKFTLSVLVKNEFGVLNRVTNMFRRRHFNIDSLSVSETERKEFSRITVTYDGNEDDKQNLINQLYKLIDVRSVQELDHMDSINAELALIKMRNSKEFRDEMLVAIEAFHGKIVEYKRDSMVIRLTASPQSIDEFIKLMSDYEIIELCRTGEIALGRGSKTIMQVDA